MAEKIKAVILTGAGPAETLAPELTGLAGPVLGAAIETTCCAKDCTASQVALTMDIPHAGLLIATLMLDAEYQDITAALIAAVDQSRSWIKTNHYQNQENEQ